jgi:hypothetical protein
MRFLTNILAKAGLIVDGTTQLNTIANATVDTDKFLVSDAGVIKYRTAPQLVADLGPLPSSILRHQVKLGEAINKGQAVYVSSADGTNMIVSKASNVTDLTSSKTLGLIETSGVTNDQVNVVTEGLLAGLDTSTATAGDPVWLGTNGNLIFGLVNKPSAPAHLVFIGVVTRVQSVNGEIFVKVQNGFEVEELHDVAISSIANKNLLMYEAATSLWKNKTLGNVIGGTSTQYVKGDGTLGSFPDIGGGGGLVYYLNGSVSSGVAGYFQMSKTPVIGSGTDFSKTGDGLICQFLTDVNDPSLLSVPSGAWRFGLYASMGTAGNSSKFYVEVFKYDGATFTLIGSSSGTPESVDHGTATEYYTTTVAMATTALTVTDRIAVKIYATDNATRTMTIHTENSNLCDIATTFPSGIASINGLITPSQYLSTTTTGTDFTISSSSNTHYFNLPVASATVTGKLSSTDWSTFNNKQNALGYTPVNQTRTLTINGVTYDLSSDRTWSVGTVTSVGLSVPTGFSVSNTPVTGSGTIGLSFTAGYSLPTTASQSNWDVAYTNRITSLTTTGTSGAATLVSNVLNIPQYQAQGSYITSLTGEATASGPGSASVTLSTSAVTGKVLTGLNVTGGTVLATDSILTAFGKLQNQVNGLAGGVTYQGAWNASTNSPSLTSSVGTKGYYYVVSVAGSTNLNGITDWKLGDWAIFNGTAWEKVDNTDAVVSVNGFTGAVSLTTTNIAEGTNLYYTDTRARAAISLTTTGTSGAATYSAGVLNIPQYSLAGLGGVPSNRTLTINGTSYDLSADRTWTITNISGTAAGETLATVTGRGASTSTDLTFNGTLTMGTGGTQYIRMGRFPASVTNTGEAWIGRASDRNSGTMTVQLGGNSASGRNFEVVDYAWSTVLFNVNSGGVATASDSFRAPYFYDSSNTSYYGRFSGTSRMYGAQFDYVGIGQGISTSYSLITNGSIYLNSNSNGWAEGTWKQRRGGATFYDVIDTGNYNSYSPTLTGGGASGTWGISITGNADTTDGYHVGNSTNQIAYWNSNRNLYVNNPENYSGEVRLGAAWDRGGVYASSTLSLSTSASDIHFVFNNATKAYFNSLGNLYVGQGTAYSSIFMGDNDEGQREIHCNSNRIGFLNQSASWGSWCEDNGSWYSAVAMYSPRFYDSDNTSYYLDPASTSILNGLQVGGSAVVTNNGGTWNINVTGSAGSASTASQVTINYNNDSNSTYQMLWGSGNSVYGTAGVYVNPNSDTVYATAFVSNGYIRIAANNNLYLDYNYGQSIVGVYASTRYQGVFAMGDSYKLPIDGTGPGNLYGLAWSHPNAGGVAGNLNDHGLLVLINGGFAAAISSSIRAASDMRAPVFYDSANTAFYLDPNATGTSLNVAGRMVGTAWTTTARNYSNEWIEFPNHSGLYSPLNGAHFYPNNATYGGWRMSGTRNGWNGMTIDANNGHIALMVNPSSNETGFHNQNYGWQIYWTSGTLYCYKSTYGGGTQATVLDSSNSPYAWNMNQYVRTTDSVTFATLSVSGATYLPNNALISVNGESDVWGARFRTTTSTTNLGAQLKNIIWCGGGASEGLAVKGVYAGAPTAFEVRNDGIVWASSSFRAPIFYDSNDTTYYADFANTGTSIFTAGIIRSSGMIMKGSSGGGQIYPTMSNGGVSLYGGNNLTNGAYFTVTGLDYASSPGAGSAEFVIRSAASSKFALFSYNGSTWTGRYGLFGSTGNVTIGDANTDIGYRLYVIGDIYATASIIAYSDERVKTNVRKIENPLDRILNTRGVIYDRTDVDQKDQIGFIAQELEEQFPELVSTSTDGRKGVMYQNMVAVLLEAIKEQQKQIDELKNK